jgi:hypothetical protein
MSQRYDAATPIVAEMSSHVRTAAAALILAGVLAGCSRTTTGTVAMTTEPGAPLTTSRTPGSRPSLPRLPTSTAPRTPNPNAPADSLTMTCEQYNALDEDTKLAVVGEIVNEEGSLFGGEGAEIAKTLADAMCQILPSAKVSEVLMGGGLPG